MSDGVGSRASVLSARDVHKAFRQGDTTIDVLSSLDLDVAAGERIAIIGRSGSGKSTLLHVLAGLDTPDSGRVEIDGVDLATASNDVRARTRGRTMGFVYQNHHLLPEFTAQENVAMPLRIQGSDSRTALRAARALLCEVGLEGRLTHLPAALSGGERQRVAVVRAVAGNPLVVLADEPTGNLDIDNARGVMGLLTRLSDQQQTACVVVTHDSGMLEYFDRVLVLDQGRLRAHS